MTEADRQQRGFVVAGTLLPAPLLAPGLYVVSTPIGNLRDITLRALETLAAADRVLCEDTRHSATLLAHYGIRTPRRALHEHNERAKLDLILDELRHGARLALISDALGILVAVEALVGGFVHALVERHRVAAAQAFATQP